MAAGDFSASQMPDIVRRIRELFDEPRSYRELQQPIESIKAIVENQRVNWGDPVTDGTKCIGVNGVFLRDCNDNTTSCADEETPTITCTVDGDEIESDGILYKPNGCIYETFSVYDDECKDILTFNEKMAFAMASKEMKILERLNKESIAFLLANTQDNTASNTGGTVVDGNTYFDATDFSSPDILAEFAYIAAQLDVVNPIMLTGRNFYNMLYNANFEKLNDDQRDRWAKLQNWDWYFDIKNFDIVAQELATLMFDAGALGFYTVNQFHNLAPMNILDSQNTHIYRYNSQKLSWRNGSGSVPAAFDVTMQRKCRVSGTAPLQQRRWGWAVEMKLTYGLHLGPTDCNGGTGIIKFVNGEAPAENGGGGGGD